MEKVMQKASMVISKRSKSKWVDDCFLLIGKSHFFRGDLFSADEAFQFVNSQYEDLPIRYEGKLWILKTLVRQGKVNDAEAIYKTFQREEKFPTYLQDELNCVVGDIYTKMGLYPDAIKYLEAGLKGTKDKVLKYRLHFLLAQLYQITKDYDKARIHYRYVAKSNAPYEFAFQSNISIVKVNSLAGKTDTRESRKNLKRMLRDDKNIDYYDQLYYELGNLDLSDKLYAKAIKNYQSAVRKSSKNQDLKANAYLSIAKIYYQNKNYRLAEKFFDSTSLFITEKHPEYEKIKQQQTVLSTLINHLITIETQDSLLRLADLPKDKLESEIRKIMANEKEIKKKAAAKKAKDNDPGNDVQPINNTTTTTQYTGTDQFIFDNQAMLGREYNDFIKRWGNRQLTDNWRITSIKKDISSEPEIKPQDTSSIKGDKTATKDGGIENSPDDLKKYYTGIPFSEKDKELAYKKILESHFEAGKIYHEKLKEYQEAIYHFLAANKRFPANVYEAEMYYYLIKCYDALPDEAQSKNYKTLLETKYPNSGFNQVFTTKDPAKPALSNDKSEKQEVLDAYSKMYNAFIAENYTLVKQIKAEVDKKYAGNAIQAKFDYLYALAIAKTESLDKYVELLKRITENYPGTEIAQQALYTLEVLDNRTKAKAYPNSIYKYDGTQTHYFGIIVDEGQSDRIKTALSNFNTKFFPSASLKTKSFLLGNKDMLGVELFANKAEALEFYKSFSLNFKEFIPDLPPEFNYFIITSDNFKTLMREMKEDEYLTFFKKMYF
jgi:tetratricopeptide (TPR) repeat protein